MTSITREEMKRALNAGNDEGEPDPTYVTHLMNDIMTTEFIFNATKVTQVDRMAYALTALKLRIEAALLAVEALDPDLDDRL